MENRWQNSGDGRARNNFEPERGERAGVVRCRICGSRQVATKFAFREFDVLNCRNCTTSFLDLFPANEELADLYSSDYYRARFEYYFNNNITNPEGGRVNENIKAFEDALCKLKEARPDRGRLLDVGCGLGIFLKMAELDGWQPRGFDASPYAVSYGRLKFGLDVVEGINLRSLNTLPCSFDVATLWDSLEHFPDPINELVEINRLLKIGGLLMLDTPNEGALLRSLAKGLYTMTGRLFKYPAQKLYHRYHLHYFTPKSLEMILRETGFEIVTLEKKRIPIVKARGSSFEKCVVKLVSYLEGRTGGHFELVALARKVKSVETLKKGP